MSAKWGMPAFGLSLGILLFAASALGGQPGTGLAMFAVMAVYSAVLLAFGGRNETVGVLSGRPIDERLAAFSLHATAFSGTVAILASIVGFVWAIAHGQDGMDFAAVAASAGIAYVAALIWLRWRG